VLPANHIVTLLAVSEIFKVVFEFPTVVFEFDEYPVATPIFLAILDSLRVREAFLKADYPDSKIVRDLTEKEDDAVLLCRPVIHPSEMNQISHCMAMLRGVVEGADYMLP